MLTLPKSLLVIYHNSNLEKVPFASRKCHPGTVTCSFLPFSPQSIVSNWKLEHNTSSFSSTQREAVAGRKVCSLLCQRTVSWEKKQVFREQNLDFIDWVYIIWNKEFASRMVGVSAVVSWTGLPCYIDHLAASLARPPIGRTAFKLGISPTQQRQCRWHILWQRSENVGRSHVEWVKV